MSIYKEENNKKDCFEHLISLQDCDHRFHANAESATREQDSDINGPLAALWSLRHLLRKNQKLFRMICLQLAPIILSTQTQGNFIILIVEV